ncbi:MAG: hypothetical protein K2O88_00165 [Paramuribaculum sp.]|nr:hypothetical protein [Paramuribaculum sp.]
MTSCSSDREKAEGLYKQAEAFVNEGNNEHALVLLDSIDHTYPGEVDVRREGMHLRPMAIEKITLAELSHTDSLLAVYSLKSDSIGKFIAKVDNPIEPYFVAAEFKDKSPVSAPGLYARITPDGQFYILSSINKPVNSTSVTISLPDGTSAQSAIVPHDGERNDKQGGAEIITFMQAECDTIGVLATKNPSAKFMLVFNGGKQYSMPLPDNQLKALATMYEAASLFRNLKVLQIRKTHLEKQLELSRSQIARTFNDKNQDN